jgi:hypothetical protein
MEAFLATGVHPEVERVRKAQQDIIPPLPERSTQRPHVLLDITINKQPRGVWLVHAACVSSMGLFSRRRDQRRMKGGWLGMCWHQAGGRCSRNLSPFLAAVLLMLLLPAL